MEDVGSKSKGSLINVLNRLKKKVEIRLLVCEFTYP